MWRNEPLKQMKSLYSEQRTWLHDVPAYAKLLVLAGLGTGLFFTHQLLWLTVSAVVCMSIFASLGRVIANTKPLLIGLFIASVLVAAFHILMQHPELAAVTVLRLISTTLMGIALTVTTRYSDLLHVFECVLSPLNKVGIASERLALQLALMLRFTEHFFMLWCRLNEAHRLRTGKAGGFKILAPLTIQMLVAARRVADTLHVRLRR
jgi:biotin transport system permease protein